MRKWTLAVSIAILGVGMVVFGSKWALKTVLAPNQALAYNVPAWADIDHLPELLAQNPIAYKKASILVKMENLASCESGGNERVINPNDNGSPSYGKYQFKLTTWLVFAGNQYPTKSVLELEGLLLNGRVQDEVVYSMLEKGLFKHWKNCSLKYAYL